MIGDLANAVGGYLHDVFVVRLDWWVLLGFAAQAFSSAEAFLASEALGETRCLILDIAMPGMSGPELQQELIRRRHQIPIVFITAHGDESVRPELLARGAAECLFKPFSETALMDALSTALRMR